MPVQSEGSPIVLNGAYPQESIHRIATSSGHWTCNRSTIEHSGIYFSMNTFVLMYLLYDFGVFSICQGLCICCNPRLGAEMSYISGSQTFLPYHPPSAQSLATQKYLQWRDITSPPTLPDCWNFAFFKCKKHASIACSHWRVYFLSYKTWPGPEPARDQWAEPQCKSSATQK